MTDLLPVLGGLTLSGSLVILFFALSCRSQYGSRWRCWIWLLLCLRMVFPVSLTSFTQMGRERPLVQLPAPSDTILYQRPTAPPPADSTDIPIHTPPPSGGQTQDHPAPPAVQEHSKPQRPVQPESSSDEFTVSLSQLLIWVWLTGAAAFLLWSLFAHLRLLSYLRRWAVPAEDAQVISVYNRLGDHLDLDRRPRLLVCPGLRAPMLAGLFHPALLLPPDTPAGSALEYALLHELIHFRRRDIWLKALSLAANAVHWFNPLMWYMVRLVERDTELACDEDAMRALPRDAHAAYGRTILDAAAKLDR